MSTKATNRQDSRRPLQRLVRRWIADKLPDDEITVLLRIKDDEWPVVLGFHEDGRWHDSNADEVADSEVIGWMHLEEAAAILDTPNAPAHRPGATTQD